MHYQLVLLAFSEQHIELDITYFIKIHFNSRSGAIEILTWTGAMHLIDATNCKWLNVPVLTKLLGQINFYTGCLSETGH